MKKDMLESSEFYNIRFHNFSTLLIIPITLILVGTILFSLVAKREIVINGDGTIQPIGIVPVIQSTTNSSIKNNYLIEGKQVKKGQKLLVYNNNFNHNKLNEDNIKKQQIQNQLVALDNFQDSINKNSDIFPTNDKFGYRELLQSYLKQRKVYLNENNMLTEKSNKIKSQNTMSTDQSKVEGVPYFDDTKYGINTNNDKLEILRNDKLSEISEKRINAEKDLLNVQSDIDNLNMQSRLYTIRANKSGVLHISENHRGTKYIHSGEIIAKIFPIIKKQSKVNINMYISTSDISSVKLNQKIRFKVTRNVPKPIILDGVVKKISVSPIEESNRSFYEVTASVPIDGYKSQLLRYGMVGKSTIITGKVTWFNYYKDKLLNNN